MVIFCFTAELAPPPAILLIAASTPVNDPVSPLLIAILNLPVGVRVSMLTSVVTFSELITGFPIPDNK